MLTQLDQGLLSPPLSNDTNSLNGDADYQSNCKDTRSYTLHDTAVQKVHVGIRFMKLFLLDVNIWTLYVAAGTVSGFRY